jgi:hypothetical protein
MQLQNKNIVWCAVIVSIEGTITVLNSDSAGQLQLYPNARQNQDPLTRGTYHLLLVEFGFRLWSLNPWMYVMSTLQTENNTGEQSSHPRKGRLLIQSV